MEFKFCSLESRKLPNLLELSSLTLSLLTSSADNLCKQFVPRSGPTKHQPRSGSKLFDPLMIFLKVHVFFEKVDFEKKSADDKNTKHYQVGKELIN